jgi:hypothetical protein
VPGIILGHHVPGVHKYGDHSLQVGGVSNETVKCRVLRDLYSRVTALQGPEAIVRVNYSPILSLEREPNIKKPTIVRHTKKSGHELQMGARYRDRLADCSLVTT